MCGRYSQTTPIDALVKRFNVSAPCADFPARFNIAPSQLAPVVVLIENTILTSMRWGLVPSWAKNESIGNRMINARAETLAEKPSFRKAFERRRCLILADGFYEWRKTDSKINLPVRFVLEDREPFAFAGLWETWRKPDGQELRSFTIITTSANDLLRPIHDRMPVILRRPDEEKWLDPSTKDAAKLLTQYPAEAMKGYDVSTLVNSPNNDSSACIQPA